MPRNLEPRDLCRQNEAARLRGVSPATIRKLTAAGKLSIVMVGCHRFLLVREVRRVSIPRTRKIRDGPAPCGDSSSIGVN